MIPEGTKLISPGEATDKEFAVLLCKMLPFIFIFPFINISLPIPTPPFVHNDPDVTLAQFVVSDIDTLKFNWFTDSTRLLLLFHTMIPLFKGLSSLIATGLVELIGPTLNVLLVSLYTIL